MLSPNDLGRLRSEGGMMPVGRARNPIKWLLGILVVLGLVWYGFGKARAWANDRIAKGVVPVAAPASQPVARSAGVPVGRGSGGPRVSVYYICSPWVGLEVDGVRYECKVG